MCHFPPYLPTQHYLVYKLVLEVPNLLQVLELHYEAALLLQLPAGGLHHLLPHLHLPSKGVVPEAATEACFLEAQQNRVLTRNEHTSEQFPFLWRNSNQPSTTKYKTTTLITKMLN